MLVFTLGCKVGTVTPPASPATPPTSQTTPPTPPATTTQTATLTIANTSLPVGYVGTAYSQTLQATGGTGTYKWWMSTGSLPKGLALDAATGIISGTPEAAATSFLAVNVSDSKGAIGNDVVLSITINLAASTATEATTLSIITTSFPVGYVGTAYSWVLQASGGTSIYTWAISAGALPDGCVLDVKTGIIAGTPKAAGTSNFTVQVADSAGGTATESLSIEIDAAPPTTTQLTTLTITTTSLPAGYVGTVYSQVVQASGGSGAYSWSYSGGSLPEGLSLDADTGIIFGTPKTPRTSNFTLQATDNAGATATESLSITIETE
jgi:hypothetical protein